jgi:hypothetical protein
MPFADLFSEAVLAATTFPSLNEGSSLPSGQVTATILAQWGEFGYHVFAFNPAGTGTRPTFDIKGQVSPNFSAWTDVPGMAFQWTNALGFGNWGVRTANYRLPSVDVGPPNGAQAFRWHITATGGAGTWTLDRAYFCWLFGKGSNPENHSSLQFQPGKPARLLLDWT